MDRHAIATALARDDYGGSVAQGSQVKGMGCHCEKIRKDFVAIHTNNAQKTQTLESTFEKVDSRDNAHFLSLQAVFAPRGKVWLLVSFGTLATAASSPQAQKC